MTTPSTGHHSVEALARRSASGDGEAFAALYDLLVADAYHLATLVGGESAACHAVEQAFVALWDLLRADDGKAAGDVVVLLHRGVLDHLPEQPDVPPVLAARYGSVPLRRQAPLTALQRSSIALACLHYKTDQIADFLHTDPDAVQNALTAGLQTLSTS